MKIRLVANPPLLFFITFYLTIFLPVHSESVSGEEVYINLPAVNLRSGPGSKYKSIGIYSKGTQFNVLRKVHGWLEVSNDKGVRGWLSQDAVTRTPPPAITISRLREEIKEATGVREKLEMRLKEIEKENLSLKEENKKMTIKEAELERKIAAIKDMKVFLWVLVGFLLLLIGWFFGFVTGILREKAEEKRLDELKRRAM